MLQRAFCDRGAVVGEQKHARVIARLASRRR
jgi:hypothetical protein